MRPLIDVTTYKAIRYRKRTEPIFNITLHDTFSHNTKGAYTALERDGCGAHYFIASDGVIFSSADPIRQVVIHSEGNNDHSIGVNVVSILDPSFATNKELERLIDKDWSPSWIKGKVIDYPPQQKSKLIELVNWLCEDYGIPKRVLWPPCGYGNKLKSASPSFRGVMANAGWSLDRWDGLLALEILANAGYEKELSEVI